MATRDFSQYFLYRWRYVIGYSLIGLLLAGLLLFAGLFLPGGLSQMETQSVIRSAALSIDDPSTLAITNLPYYALQSFIFSIFGVSLFTIKLPSLILALFTAVGFIMLLRRWFRPNIAVLASMIAITTGQFLFIAQSGTPSILYVFWPVALLLLGTQITRIKNFRLLWKALFAITAALSLYTPLGIYPLLAILLAIIFHPHLRAVVRKLSRTRITIVTLLFALLVAPLGWLISLKPSLGLSLIGVPTSHTIDFSSNIAALLTQYFLFWEPAASEVMTPVFGLGSALLIGLGLYRLIRTRDTTRSYLIIFWIVCLTPMLIINPDFTSVTFVPSMLMLAAGLTSLIGYWYRLFPLNPYARITGLFPIIILVAALITTGLTRYVYGYHYSPQVAPLFSKDLSLVPSDTNILVVSDTELPFYEAIARYRDGLNVSTKATGTTVTVTRAQKDTVPTTYSITKIITNPQAREADRFYVMSTKSTQDK